MSISKKVLYTTSSLLIFALAMVTAVYVFLSTPTGEKFIKNSLVHQVEKQLNVTLSLEHLETNIYGRIVLNNLLLRDAISSDTLLSFRRLQLNYSLRELLTPPAIFRALFIDELYVNIQRNDEGNLNLTSLMKEPAPLDSNNVPSQGIQVQLMQLRLSNSRIQYIDSPIDLIAEMHALNIQLNLITGGAYSIELESKSIATHYGEIEIPLRDIKAEVFIDNKDIKFDPLTFSIHNLDLVSKGYISQNEQVYELRTKGNLDSVLMDFNRSHVADVYPTSGDLDLDVKVHIHEKSMEIGYDIDIKDILYGADDFLVDELKVKGKFLDNNILMEELLLRTAGISFIANGSVDSMKSLHFDLNIASGRINVKELNKFYADMSGVKSINGDFHIQSEFSDFIGGLRTEGLLEVKGLAISENVYPDIKVVLNASDGVANLKGNLPNINLAVNMDLLERDELNFDLKWDSPKWLLETVKLEQTTFNGLVNGSLNLKDSLYINLSNYQFNAFDGSLNGNALLQLDSLLEYRLSVEFEGFDVATIYEWFNQVPSELSGKLHGNINSSGSVKDLKSLLFEGSVNYTQIVFYGDELPDVNFALSVTADELNSHFQLLGTEGNIALVFKGDDIKGSYEVHIKELASIAYLANITELSGELELAGTVGGSYENPKLDLTFGSRNIVYQEIRIDSTQGKISWENRNLQFDRFSLNGSVEDLAEIPFLKDQVKGGNAFIYVDLSGAIERLNGRVDFRLSDVELEKVTIDSMNASVKIEENQAQFERVLTYVSGLSIELGGNLHLYPMKGDVSVFVMDSNINSKGIPYVEIEAEFDLSEAQAFMLSRLDGTVDFSILNKLHIIEHGISGKADVNLIAQKRGDQLYPTFDGDLQLTSINFEMRETSSVLLIEEALIEFSQDSIIIQKFFGGVDDHLFGITGFTKYVDFDDFNSTYEVLFSDGSSVNIEGMVSKAHINLAAELNSFNLDVVDMFVPSIKEPHGILNTNIMLKGSLATPKISGTLSADGVAFKMVSLPLNLSEGSVKVTFVDDILMLDTLSIGVNDGHISAKGTHALVAERNTPTRLNLQAENIVVNQPNQYKVSVDKADLAAVHKDGITNVTGDLVFGNSRYTKMLQTKMLLDAVRNSGREKSEDSPLAESIRFNIRVKDSEDLWIDNNLAKINLHAELNITGTAAKPNLSGRLQTVSGYINYLDRRFDVEHAVLDFFDPNSINPVVDIKAIAVIRNYQSETGTPYVITLTISGPADEAIFSMTSDPPLEMADIVSVLTLGVTRDNMWGGSDEGTSVGDVLKYRLDDYSSRRVYGYVSRHVGNMLGLDRMTIEGSLFKVNEGSGPKVTAAKKLSDRLELSYTTVIGQSYKNKVIATYSLTERWVLQGDTEQSGKSGADVMYRIRF